MSIKVSFYKSKIHRLSEDGLSFFHLATTEDVIDIDDLDYEWQLSEATKKLEDFVKSFKLYKIGLNDDITTKVCPEANVELYECIESTTTDNVQAFYQECLNYINEIFEKGADDLQQLLGTIFFRFFRYLYIM